jgi:hypothetical protein
MDRKLASVQKIVALSPIEKADAIEKATVLGWELVVKKGEFKVGDLVVYCEVDSILPDKSEFEFLRDRKFRIKTIKLRGQISQGICFPLSILPKGKYSEGDDVTETIGIVKYDPQKIAEDKLFNECSGKPRNKFDRFIRRFKWYRRLTIKVTKLPFPSFIRKTDEDRIQLFPSICEDHKDTIFQETEKVDGQSGSFFVKLNPIKWEFWEPYLFGVCSRNWQLVKPDHSSYWTIAKKLDLKKKMIALSKRYGQGIVIQGEIAGPGIQKNKYHLNEYHLFVFNIFLSENGTHNKVSLDLYAQLNICDALGLETVPFIDGHFKLLPSIPEMVNLAKGQSQLYNTKREGVVIRNYEKNISFKVINPEFLLEEE